MARPGDKILFTKVPYVEDTEPRRIESIKFGILSEPEIRKQSEVDVWRAAHYDLQKKPLPNGLLDPRMGPPNKTAGPCSTCHGKFEDCPGHYGCLTLQLPVFNIGYYGHMLEILKCICKSCSKILLDEKEFKAFQKKMRNPKADPLKKNELKKKIVAKCSGKTIKCTSCGYQNGKIKKDKSVLTIIHDRPRVLDGDRRSTAKDIKETSTTSVLNPVHVLSLFRRMRDQDCEVLYLNHRPEKLLLVNIPVPPLALRPSVFVDGGSQSNENDITERLKEIIRDNNCLREELEESRSGKIMVHWETLQNSVALYINSDARIGQFPGDVGKPLSGFVQRLKGKQGRFRQNLSGKRVQYTGRTVISPDPNLKITEVAIPIHMAVILTYPERVNRHNIEKLRQCVHNGPKKYPGAKFITEPNGTMRDLTFGARKRVADELKFGDIVHRHLEDGDVVLFNRQPSLHRMSIMSHRARIMQWRTLRFNESVCNPYNADFDGDEMNLHVPQSEEARTEALMLMGVQNNLCTPKNGVVLVASTQDFLTSSFLITRRDIFYDRATFSLMCCYMGDGMDHIDLPTPALLKPIELWTGKQLLNVLLRPHADMRVYVNLMVKEKIYCEPKDRVTKLKDETMCPNDGFVYFRNSELISGQLGKVTLGNGNKTGLYSVLLRDYNAHAAATCMNRLAKLSARWIGNHGFSIGIDDVQPGKLLNDKKGETVMEAYGECDKLIGSYRAGKLSLPESQAAQALEDGIFGKLDGIRKTTSKVCMNELHWRNSPLIMSQCGSKGSPLNICQMVACVGQQAVNGRRVVEGFVGRCLPHFPTGLNTYAGKGFVANSFYSGLTATEFFFHTMAGREGLVDTAVKTADTGYMSRRLMKALEDLAVYYDMTVRSPSGTIVQFVYGDDSMDPAQMEGSDGFPLDFERLLLKAQATCPDTRSMLLSTVEAREKIWTICKDAMNCDGVSCSPVLEKLSKFVETALSEHMWRITEKQLEVFLSACTSRLLSKRMEAGTAIGAIGAQSIGEPGTQMTLKTFHFAGLANLNMTSGVPRIKEIIDCSKKIKTPVITAKLEDMKTARLIKGHIEKTLLEQVVKSIKQEMTPIKSYIIVKLDPKKINALQLRTNAYCIREKISQSLKNKSIKQLSVVVVDAWKLHVIPEATRDNLHFVLDWLIKRLPMVVVKGINTVERAVVDEKHGNLLVEGMGLLDVMGVDGIVGTQTSSNHFVEVVKVLGIEAARTTIIREIELVMRDMAVDIRHMMLLGDVMTFKGEILAITRVGISKMKDSVLMLASFEKTADHLFNASVNGRYEKIEGITECIIMGVPMQVGTGMLKVMQRAQEVPRLNYNSTPNLLVS